MDNFLDPRKKPTEPRPTLSGKISYGHTPASSKPSTDDDIAAVWDEQKRIRAQDKLLEIEYEIAKEKARRLKEQIKKNQIGDETIFGEDLKKYMPGYQPVAKNSLKLAQKALERTAAKAQQFKSNAKIKIAAPPVRPPMQPAPVIAAETPLPVAKQRSKKPLFALASLILLAGVSSGGFMLYKRQAATDTKSAVLGSLINDAATVDSMYFPSAFPDGYSESGVKANRPEDAKNVYILTLNHASDPSKSIFISQQDLPKDFNVNEFNATLENAEMFSVNAGRATMGEITADNMHVVSILGQQHWILVNAPNTVSLENLRLVAAGLDR